MQWIPLAFDETAPPLHALLRTHGFNAILPLKENETAALVAEAGLTSAEAVDTRVSNQEIAVTLAANLKLGSIFSGDVQANETGFWLDAMAYTDRFEEEPASGGLVVAVRYGFGLRVLFRVRKLDAKFNLNYGLIGAALDAKFATGSYQVEAIGLGAGALSTILEGIADTGLTISGDTFYKLNSAILKNLVAYIKANLGTLKPKPVSALVRSVLEPNSLDTSRAVLFAVRAIRSGRSLREALDDFDEIDRPAVRLAYKAVMGDVPDSKHPESSDKKRADEWLEDK